MVWCACVMNALSSLFMQRNVLRNTTIDYCTPAQGVLVSCWYSVACVCISVVPAFRQQLLNEKASLHDVVLHAMACQSSEMTSGSNWFVAGASNLATVNYQRLSTAISYYLFRCIYKKLRAFLRTDIADCEVAKTSYHTLYHASSIVWYQHPYRFLVCTIVIIHDVYSIVSLFSIFSIFNKKRQTLHPGEKEVCVPSTIILNTLPHATDGYPSTPSIWH